ncbi:hypothetical protein C8J57DRAFT_1252029 [Mycena rebaudengoi]|nr:hypothetical protein C8J57DRAFT_1252029 [Mycena rebaudengoi]
MVRWGSDLKASWAEEERRMIAEAVQNVDRIQSASQSKRLRVCSDHSLNPSPPGAALSKTRQIVIYIYMEPKKEPIQDSILVTDVSQFYFIITSIARAANAVPTGRNMPISWYHLYEPSTLGFTSRDVTFCADIRWSGSVLVYRESTLSDRDCIGLQNLLDMVHGSEYCSGMEFRYKPEDRAYVVEFGAFFDKNRPEPTPNLDRPFLKGGSQGGSQYSIPSSGSMVHAPVPVAGVWTTRTFLRGPHRDFLAFFYVFMGLSDAILGSILSW